MSLGVQDQVRLFSLSPATIVSQFDMPGLCYVLFASHTNQQTLYILWFETISRFHRTVPPSIQTQAYYIKARKWHPDKNNSEEAKVKFQEIGEAYQVLGDEKLRAVYDAQGEAGLSGDRTEVSLDKVDPSLIFTFLFGNDSFNDIVGRLQLVTQTLVAGDVTDGQSLEVKIDGKQLIELERRRVLRLALSLRKRISNYMKDGSDVESCKKAWTVEGEKLVEVRYGEEILNTVGKTYKLVATQIIGSWTEGMDAKVEAAEMKMDAAKNAANAAQTAQDGSAEAEGGNLPSVVELYWNITVIDITTTIREVVMKVCKDTSVDSDTRKKRAKAIVELGTIWESLKSKNADPEKVKTNFSRFQSATAAAMEATIEKVRLSSLFVSVYSSFVSQSIMYQSSSSLDTSSPKKYFLNKSSSFLSPFSWLCSISFDR